MPILTNPKHEVFAQSIADGMKVIDAYEHAGYPRSPSAASQLKKRPEIQERVQEIIAGARDEAIRERDLDPDALPETLNQQWLIKTLMKNVQIAQRASQIAPANKAVEMLAQIIGISTGTRGKGIPITDDDENSGDESPHAEVDVDKASEAFERMLKIIPAGTPEESKTDDEE